MTSSAAKVLPLVLATMTSQALLVVLAPTVVAVGAELGTTVGAAGQARSVTAAVSVAVSLLLGTRPGLLSVRRLLVAGSVLAVLASGAVAAAGSTATFLAAHVLVGLAFALLLSGGFAGLAAFDADRRPWATGYVAGSNALAWILVTPAAGVLTEAWSWRAAEALPAALAVAALVAAPAARPAPSARAGAALAPLRVGVARRWIVAEVAGYAAWTSLLTFAGAFFVQRLGVRESLAGWLLAGGAGAYLLASVRSGRLSRRVPRRRLVATAALIMAVLLPMMLAVARSAPVAVALFCLLGLAAGIRTPVSASLGLDQLPAQPAAMMTARTGATQTGYLVGAVVGGAVISGAGYPALGLVLAVVMATSAALVLGVDDPEPPRP
ncbi:MFS transporter [Georgenia ruanii]|uniref:MFS transporter n=1 Tax=Georgenia ruanii TaxID=348442 RepID=A0A7J9UT69_9MICO|nr:MFS transporter [Georgenia ruanii]MPV87817.1 MFS transporter [Georgenia ruanii]